MHFTRRQLDFALGAAHRYHRFSALGDVVLAEQVSRTIDDLVGYWHRRRDGTFVLRWPKAVKIAARGGVQR